MDPEKEFLKTHQQEPLIRKYLSRQHTEMPSWRNKTIQMVGLRAANTSGLWHKQLFLWHVSDHGWIIMECWLSSMLQVAHVFLWWIDSLRRWAAPDVNLTTEEGRIFYVFSLMSLCQAFWRVWKSMKFRGAGKVRKYCCSVIEVTTIWMMEFQRSNGVVWKLMQPP